MNLEAEQQKVRIKISR